MAAGGQGQRKRAGAVYFPLALQTTAAAVLFAATGQAEGMLGTVLHIAMPNPAELSWIP
jgi:hypothetical protein